MKKIIFFFILLSPILLISLVNESNLPVSNEFSKERCTRYCHNVKCFHFEKKLNSKPSNLNKTIHFLVEKNIDLLKKNPFGLDYKSMNLLVYILLFPTLIFLLLFNLFRKFQIMKNLIEKTYWYCTDFCINAANALEISYFEFNFWLFLVVLPSTATALILFNLNGFIKTKAARKQPE